MLGRHPQRDYNWSCEYECDLLKIMLVKKEKRAKEKIYLRNGYLLHKYFLSVHYVPGTGL